MLKKLTLFLFLFGAILSSRAETVEVDGIRYILDTTNNTASVTYFDDPIGSGSIITGLYTGNISIPEVINYDGNYYTVTSIGSNAFMGSSKLTGISLPNTITEIGSEAFYQSNALTEIDIPQSVRIIGARAFQECSSLVSVKIHDVQTIGVNAFNYVAGAVFYFNGNTPPQVSNGNNSYSLGIESIIIVPAEVKTQYINTFSDINCYIFADDEVPQTNTSQTDYVISTTAINGLSGLFAELIKSNGLNAKPYVQNLKITGTLNTYDFNTIRSLSNLVNLDLSEVIIDSHGGVTFSKLYNLENIVFPTNLTAIEGNAFYGCTSLQSIGDLPNVVTIGNQAFFSCSSLQSVGDMPKLESIGSSAFGNCKSLQTIGNMPQLKSIDSSAFGSCFALQMIGDLPSLTTIGNNAFSRCTSLQTIGELSALTYIGAKAFADTQISQLFLPNTLKNVETSAFSAPTIVHFAGVTPPSFVGTSIPTPICVPASALDAYINALPDMPATDILVEELTTYDINATAQENDSDVLSKINEGTAKDNALNVINLKVSGTINSYDIIAFRNKMLNLRKLDLSDATIKGCSYEYYTGCHTEDNIISDNMFREMNISEIVLPNNIISLGKYAFYSCIRLRSINLPDEITSIGESAFYKCTRLRTVKFPQNLIYLNPYSFYACESFQEAILPPSLTKIPNDCFVACSQLKKLSLPPTLKSIGSYAFLGCESLTEFKIPAGVTYIGSGAIPATVKDVYTYTIQPTAIEQSTFDSDTYLTATLHVPETSEKLYYWNTQWSQFQNIENFNEPYTYFYLEDQDLIEDPDTPRIEGETDEETGDKKNPDADLGEGSGLIVDGDNSQDLGNVDLEHDGKGDGATIIGGDSDSTESGGNVNIDMLNIKIPVVAKKWYFFAFPFDIEMKNIQFDGQMVWRYYDGGWRAMHGSGSWKDVTDDRLKRGQGYIFQGSKKGTLTLSIPKAHFDGKNWLHELQQHVSEFAQDASWNFIGNPFQSYYELADLGFDGPITWWNPDTNSYEAFSPLDDDLSMYPFMAFFVQKPEGTDGVEFYSEHRETRNQKNDPNHRSSARIRRASRRMKAADGRMLVNLTVTDGSNADRTRVVFNTQASDDYEVGVDASKFVSTDAPQIYSIDGRNVRYAINERPAGDGIVKLGFYAPASGIFTIECKRSDCPVTLKDCETGMVVNLTPGKTYEFHATGGYDDSRFVLNAEPDATSSVDTIINTEETDATYYRLNGMKDDGSHPGVMIEVKGNEAAKVIRK